MPLRRLIAVTVFGVSVIAHSLERSRRLPATPPGPPAWTALLWTQAVSWELPGAYGYAGCPIACAKAGRAVLPLGFADRQSILFVFLSCGDFFFFWL